MSDFPRVLRHQLADVRGGKAKRHYELVIETAPRVTHCFEFPATPPKGVGKGDYMNTQIADALAQIEAGR